ncbi:MAG TPA: NAD(P)-dependent oxidoreductase [Actinomycetes bacterium]|jgi:3-hydroxyisobutyrate dehydrogenase|nr:NAD(P)-dependent oxidoreductase [Actinomycetes bacterium]
MGDKGTVAVLGTGIMGAAMARRLCGAGFDVRVWNRTRERAEPLAEAGASVAASPAEAADQADYILTVLADGGAVEAVMFGPDGAAGTAGDDVVWLQMSTVGVRAAEVLGRAAALRDLVYVDAPVLGTREPAERGQLLVLASGPDDARDRCAPVFEAVAGRVLWLGPAGAGSRLKLVVNAWLLGLLGALAESVALAQCIGADPAQFLDAIRGGPLGAPYADLKGRMMMEADFPPSFALHLAHKDVRLVLEAAGDCDMPLPLAGTMAQQFGRATQLGHGDEDLAAVYYAVTGNKAL